MTWNYRIIKTKHGYSLHEVFYDEQSVPNGYTEDPKDL